MPNLDDSKSKFFSSSSSKIRIRNVKYERNGRGQGTDIVLLKNELTTNSAVIFDALSINASDIHLCS